MGGLSDRLLPVFAALVVSFVILAGCMEPQSGGAGPAEDGFGASVEAMNARIASATGAAAIGGLQSEVAALRQTAQSEGKYSSYLPLLEAQELALESLSVHAGFVSESAKIASEGVDCGKDYSAFISGLRGADAKASSAISKANAYLSANPASGAGKLAAAVNATGPASMAAYADILEAEILQDCLATKTPPVQYALPLSFEDALDIASAVAGDTYYVYGLDHSLPAGSVITAPRAFEDRNFTLESESWFFFLDSGPQAPFGHDTKFVIIDRAAGTFVVSNETMFPLVDRAPLWKTIDERMDPDNVLYPSDASDFLARPANLTGDGTGERRVFMFPLAGDLSAANAGKPVADAECCLERKRFALIMTGSNDSMFQADTKRMYEHLKASGYSDSDINYLAAAAGVDGGDSVTSVPNLAAALESLIANAKCCDDIFIYLAGHGSQDRVWLYRNKETNATKWIRRVGDLGANPAQWEHTGSTGYFHKIDVNGGSASSQVLSSFLGRMKSCRIAVMYQSCYSGAAAPTLAGNPGVTVMTPVDGEHSSYGMNAAGDGWGAGSFFSQAFISARTTANATADANRDGKVSDKEAFDYADRRNREIMEDERAYWQRAADNETNPARKRRYQANADGVHRQDGVYREGGPCRCCYVNCSEATAYLCKVFEGRNLPDCPDCKKVGDYCGPDTAAPPGVDMPPAGNGSDDNITGGAGDGNGSAVGAGGQPPGEDVPAVCGDGQITGAEQCDHGNHSTNKCPEGQYCSKCGCKKLETSVVCGDGKISVPKEDCDGGSVDYKLCQPGYTCSICKCVPAQAQCGDGRVTPPEECDHGNSYTSECPGGKACYSCRCLNPEDVPEEAYCGNNKREGAEECDGTDDSACGSDEACTSCSCVPEPAEEPPEEAACGNGDIEPGEECESDSDCGSGEHCSACSCVSTPAYCGDGAINGNEECDPDAAPSGCDEPQACGNNCKCVSPPSLNCESVCALTSGAQVVGSGFATQSQCQAAASSFFTSRTCYTTCKYSWFYRVDNVAGYASCCCGMKKEFPCDDCPGENPYCTPAETICPANAPSWHSP